MILTLIIIFILFFSIIIHEYAHGWVAYKLGDPTPLISKRLTLNPFVHIDLWGTILLPFLLLVITRGGFTFGYAKPIPINPYNFKEPKRDIMWVGIAGPTSNFLLALFLAQLLKISLPLIIAQAIAYGVLINLLLGIFNLIPIPPLDGSRVLTAFLPPRVTYNYLKLELLGFFIIIFLIGSGAISWLILPVIKFILSILGVREMIEF
ncbi:MAG: hypothetical protein B6D56_03705 [Candidatus Omnitrophica bacterium 4484_70.1]|nr:MAG: hypothetical protein B6D56_03705 [Candidatus Omnitrophica bacterium 4484_70.1]